MEFEAANIVGNKMLLAGTMAVMHATLSALKTREDVTKTVMGLWFDWPLDGSSAAADVFLQLVAILPNLQTLVLAKGFAPYMDRLARCTIPGLRAFKAPFCAMDFVARHANITALDMPLPERPQYHWMELGLGAEFEYFACPRSFVPAALMIDTSKARGLAQTGALEIRPEPLPETVDPRNPFEDSRYSAGSLHMTLKMGASKCGRPQRLIMPAAIIPEFTEMNRMMGWTQVFPAAYMTSLLQLLDSVQVLDLQGLEALPYARMFDPTAFGACSLEIILLPDGTSLVLRDGAWERGTLDGPRWTDCFAF